MAVLSLHDVVVYPYMAISLFVGREEPIRYLKAAMNHDKKIMLVVRKGASTSEPGVNGPLTVGTVASILQILRLPDGTVKVLIEGLRRARISVLSDNGEHFSAKAEYLESPTIDEWKQEVLVYAAISQSGGYIKPNRETSPEMLTSLNSTDDLAHLMDTIAVYMPLKLVDRQFVPEMSDTNECLEYLAAIMESEIDLLQVEKRVRNRVRKRVEKSQREYYPNEQMKAIRKELGEMDDAPDENEALKRKIDAARMPRGAKRRAEVELQKLKIVSPMSAETTVARGYIDWMVQMPWNTRSKVKKGLRRAQEIFDTDHYGLGRVKDRILEYLAVQSRVNKIKGPILCLVGPPGVGKTSLSQSIAKATGCRCVHMVLGGARDEAEIRGHRRTYISSMPGKLTQKMAKVGVKSPLFPLDEIGKISSDMRGDLASVLLEVLDPEQNVAFSDHYLRVNYDLSDVMFAVIPNSMNIPVPLLDCMEVVHPSGYIEDEKPNTAKRHLLPKQIERNALEKGRLTADNSATIGTTRYYTREAGARGLEHGISKLRRKAVKQLLFDKSLRHIGISDDNLYNCPGIQRFGYGRTDNGNRVDQVTGLAWMEMGGDLLTVETVCVLREGKLTYTDSLGEVMQESIQAALTVVHVRAEKLGINPDSYEKRDIHVHVPEDTTLKDSSGAGIAMCTMLVSCLTGNPVRADVTITGEITLRGQVLSIGDLKEELLATHRGGTKTASIPFENKRGLEEIPDNVIADLDIHSMKRAEEVLTLALQNEPSGMQVVAAE